MTGPTDGELAALEAAVERALAGEPGTVTVLGYGEISSVLRLDAAAGSFACKRLPPFPRGQKL